jgi:hypothetical protein
MNNPTPILEQAKRRIGAAGEGGTMMGRIRGKVACVLVLAVLSLAATATLSPHPTADGGNEDVAQVTSSARFKTH